MMFLPAALVEVVTRTPTIRSPTRTMSAVRTLAHAVIHLVSMMMTPAAHEMNPTYSDTWYDQLALLEPVLNPALHTCPAYNIYFAVIFPLMNGYSYLSFGCKIINIMFVL